MDRVQKLYKLSKAVHRPRRFGVAATFLEGRFLNMKGKINGSTPLIFD
jgi:hypothetical protein